MLRADQLAHHVGVFTGQRAIEDDAANRRIADQCHAMLPGVGAERFVPVRSQAPLQDAHQRSFGFDYEDSHVGSRLSPGYWAVGSTLKLSNSTTVSDFAHAPT